jgi:hypothetical protein
MDYVVRRKMIGGFALVLGKRGREALMLGFYQHDFVQRLWWRRSC